MAKSKTHLSSFSQNLILVNKYLFFEHQWVSQWCISFSCFVYKQLLKLIWINVKSKHGTVKIKNQLRKKLLPRPIDRPTERQTYKPTDRLTNRQTNKLLTGLNAWWKCFCFCKAVKSSLPITQTLVLWQTFSEQYSSRKNAVIFSYDILPQ